MIETSENIGELSKALVVAQGLVKGAGKDSKNPAFKSSYASLEAVVDAAKPALQAAGVAFTQAPGAVLENGAIEVTTMLVHGDSGQWMRSTLHVVLGKRDPQGIGSAITYGCRYSLMSVLGIPPVDDDGEGAKESKPQLSSYRAKQIINTQAITDLIDKATTDKRLAEVRELITKELWFLPGAWMPHFLDRMEQQAKAIANGGVVEDSSPGAEMDQQFRDTMGGADTLAKLKRSVDLVPAENALKKAKSPEDLASTWDAEVEGKFTGDAKEYLRNVYDAALREFGVAVE